MFPRTCIPLFPCTRIAGKYFRIFCRRHAPWFGVSSVRLVGGCRANRFGKTTSAIGTAEALARLGHTVTVRDADPSGAATLWAHKALSAGRPLPFGVEVVSRFTVAAPAEEESWRSTSR